MPHAARPLLIALLLLATPARAQAPAPDPARLAALQAWLAAEPEARPPLGAQPWARAPLARSEVAPILSALWADRAARYDPPRRAQLAARRLEDGPRALRFTLQETGSQERPRPLWISLHGGGNAAPGVNDQQWQNQQRLYQPPAGLYLCPRAPGDTWDLWHRPEVDRLLGRLIEDLIALEGVDPDRVYLQGYSAGGDGVYQLAPRLADRFAAASMMAGHPNDASPLGLRNLPFSLHVGGRDEAYGRNRVAAEWGRRLADLACLDGEGYRHWAPSYPKHGHWLEREDAAALPWMAGFRRDPAPRRVVWVQDEVVHARLYWLAVAPADARPRARLIAEVAGQRLSLRGEGAPRVRVRLDDRLLDLDQPVLLAVAGQPERSLRVTRSVVTLAETLAERGDPRAVFSAELTVELPEAR